ncbi:MAG TPA: hypothetical protein VHG08_10285 [Longimicrobium sp.]|nr:hypothetical protein [Longimicrobium sp.]
MSAPHTTTVAHTDAPPSGMDRSAPAAARAKIDVAIAAGVVLLYLLLSLALLPASEYPRALGYASLIFAAVAAAAWAIGPGTPGLGVMAVAFAAFWVLGMPTLPAMGGRYPVAMPLAFLGTHAAALLWAVLRWRARPPGTMIGLKEAWSVSLRWIARKAAPAALLVLIGLVASLREVVVFLWMIPAYIAGFGAAATAYWALQRIAHLATARYLMGFLAATCVYGAVGPVVFLMRDEPMDIGLMVLLGVVAGGFVGPPVAFVRAPELPEAPGVDLSPTPRATRAQRRRGRAAGRDRLR